MSTSSSTTSGTPLADGFDEILYPGEMEHRTLLKRSADGIFVEDST
jgi:LDH2 family malate/lactate/ureidoglycolate dehydrogenase